MFIEANRHMAKQQGSLGGRGSSELPSETSLSINGSGYSLVSSGLDSIEKGMRKPILLAKSDEDKDTSSAHKESAKEVGKEAAEVATGGAAGGAVAGGLAGAAMGAAAGGLAGAAIGVVKYCGACHK